MHQTSKKPVLVSAIFVPVIDNKGEQVVLKRIPSIHYPVWFQESQKQVKTLLSRGSKVNAMSSAYVEGLDLKTRKTNVKA